MSEALIWATYSTAIVPAFLLRRFGYMKLRFAVPLAAFFATAIWCGIVLYTGSDTADPWFGIGAFISFCFSAAFSLIGIGAAMWRQ